MRKSVLIAVAIATLVKLALAWFTIGTSDVVTWWAFANNAASCGGCVYSQHGPYGDPFNHPPFIIYFLKLLALAGNSFPFWLRLPSILADIGTVSILARATRLSTASLIVLSLNPVSILVSGFHGNTDPVMIFFVVMAVYAVSKRQWSLAGLAFGMALDIKIMPVILLPAILLQPATWSQRIRFCATLVVAVVLPALPYLSHAQQILASVVGYRGMNVNWGLTHYFNIAHAPLDMLAAPMRIAILIGSICCSWWMVRKGRSLLEICCAVLLLFYFLTPTLGYQYLVWAVPFVIIRGVASASVYYVLAGALAALQYHRWSHGLWYFADSHSVPNVTAETELLSFALWVTSGILLWSCLTKSSQSALSSSERTIPANTYAHW